MKVEVKIRQDKERGLFATDDIKKGEFICVLPIDYFQLDGNWYSLDDNKISRINFRYGIICEIAKNGSEYESFNLFYTEKKCKCCLTSITSKTINIIGISDSELLDGIFIGHMINDYVNMSFISENTYEKMSTEYSNVKVSPKLKTFADPSGGKKLGLKIIASKDIKKGNELYLTYGSEYWKKYSGKKQFIHTVKLLQIEN